jgi:hypothetical protein
MYFQELYLKTRRAKRMRPALYGFDGGAVGLEQWMTCKLFTNVSARYPGEKNLPGSMISLVRGLRFGIRP